MMLATKADNDSVTLHLDKTLSHLGSYALEDS